MKYIFAIFVGLFTLVYPAFAVFAFSPNVFDSSGFNAGNANGCWEGTALTGSSNNLEWVNTTGGAHWHMSYNNDTYWRIEIGSAQYYGIDGGGITPVGVTWIDNGGGTPIGTFTFRDSTGSCTPTAPPPVPIISGISNITPDILMMFIYAPLIALFIYLLVKLLSLFKW